jgi:hypothetical protein
VICSSALFSFSWSPSVFQLRSYYQLCGFHFLPELLFYKAP